MTPLLNWTNVMSVGIAACDEDHEKIIDMINQLYDGIQAGHSKEVLGDVLDKLIAYASEDFKREEEFFEQTGYPDADAHRIKHQEFTKYIFEIQKQFKAGTSDTLSDDVMGFLLNWVVQHIITEDKKFMPHLSSNGIK